MWSHLVGIMTKRGRKPRANFSPACAGVESTAPNLFQPLRKRVADMKHGFESRWGHHEKTPGLTRFRAQLGDAVVKPGNTLKSSKTPSDSAASGAAASGAAE